VPPCPPTSPGARVTSVGRRGSYVRGAALGGEGRMHVGPFAVGAPNAATNPNPNPNPA